MKASELIAELSACSGDYEVFIADTSVGVVAEPTKTEVRVGGGAVCIAITCMQTKKADEYADLIVG